MKHFFKINRLVAFLLMVMLIAACEKESISKDETIEQYSVKSTTKVTSSPLEQFTPEQANWTTFSSKPLATGINTSHAPDDIGWISEAQWENAKWDGVTTYDPSKMSREEFYKALFPYPDVVRGIREVYYEHQPFADPSNPTKAEVDEWHRICINHLRALVGYTSEEYQIEKNHCLSARALWNDERKFTTMWDAKYPGKWGSAYGPCQGSENGHCGGSFVPDKEDRTPYLLSDYEASCQGLGKTTEGIFSAAKSNIPWSIKWVRPIGNYLRKKGFWAGHAGPWFHRKKFGFSFWDSNPNNQHSIAILRAKWGGELAPNKYKKTQ